MGCQFQSGPKLRVPDLSAPTAVPESTPQVLNTWRSTNSGAPGTPTRAVATQPTRSPEEVKLRQDLLRERETHHEGGGQWRVPD